MNEERNIFDELFEQFEDDITNVEMRYGIAMESKAKPDLRIVSDDEDENENPDDKSGQIARLNDRFRQNYPVPSDEIPGQWQFSEGISKLGHEVEARVGRIISDFCDDDFDDECQNRDYGALIMEDGKRVIWMIKIYADKSCSALSNQPHEPAASYRVLQAMFSDE